MSNDVTKQINHIYWLWLCLGTLAGLTGAGYLALRDRDDCLAEKIGANELKLQVQLTEIKTQLHQMNITLFELKRETIRRNEP